MQAGLLDYFKTLKPHRQKAYVNMIEESKTETIKKNRIQKMIFSLIRINN
ncbi:MAG: YdeI/OmpD-associated family protein [Micrococcaceae bacterium]